MKNKYKIIPIFIPHLGCPHDCSFCNQKKITGISKAPTESDILTIINEYIQTFKENELFEIAFYGGSFTAMDINIQKMYLQAIHDCKDIIKNCIGIRISTRPDYINESILKLLKEYNVKTIELGAQSLDDTVLELNKRGHSSNDVYQSSRMIQQNGFILGIQTMTGLIGDTDDKSVNTAKKVAALKPDFVRIYPTLTIRDTYLEEQYNKGLYIPQTLDRAVELAAKLIQIYNDNNIRIIRVGLCPTKDINEHADVVAGPFHPAFRQIAESLRIYNILDFKITNTIKEKPEQISIYSNSRNISNIVGHKRSNINKLKLKFNINLINVIGDDSLTDEIKIKCFNKQEK